MPTIPPGSRKSFAVRRSRTAGRWSVRRFLAVAVVAVGLAGMGSPALDDWRRSSSALGAGDSAAVELLSGRLAELELQNRIIKEVGAFCLLLVGLLFLLPRPRVGGTVDANRIVLRDRSGKLRVGLTPEAGLVLLDADQKPRVELSAGDEAAALKLFDGTRDRRTELSQGKDGAVLAISDSAEKTRTALFGVSQDGATLSLANGSSVVTVAAAPDGPSLVFLHSGVGRGTLEVLSDGPRVTLADAAANPLLVLEGQSHVDAGERDPEGLTSVECATECATDGQPGTERPVPLVPDSDTRDGTEVKRSKAA